MFVFSFLPLLSYFRSTVRRLLLINRLNECVSYFKKVTNIIISHFQIKMVFQNRLYIYQNLHAQVPLSEEQAASQIYNKYFHLRTMALFVNTLYFSKELTLFWANYFG